MRRALLTATVVALGVTTPTACAPATGPDRPSPVDSAEAAAPTVDARAALAFFPLAEALAADREPDERLWRGLLDSPATAVLAAAGLPGDTLAGTYAMALRPSQSDQRQMIDRSSSLGRMVGHIAATARRREELETFLAGIDARSLGVDVERLARFVPTAWRDGRPTVALAVFGPDVREGEVVVVDLMLARDSDLGPYLGHEAFQWHRRRHRAVDPSSADPADADLLWALDRLQARGIANQVDKAPVIDGSRPVPEAQRGQMERFRQAISKSPETIRMLDRLLATVAADPGRRAELGAEIRRTLPQGGHPTGFYMATVILESGAHDELVATADDPFAFVELYQRAAGRPGSVAPALSPEAMDAVRALAARYLPAVASAPSDATPSDAG